MSDAVVFLALVAFSLFLVSGKYRNYASIAGWGCIVLNLFLELPAFIAESNFFYPILAVLSVPFLIITVRHLMLDDPVALALSTTAAVATLIFVPFALVPGLRDALIGIVISWVYYLVNTLGHYPALYAWDVIAENGFYNQIILGCTGILAIAVMTGIIAGAPGASFRQRILVIVPVVLTLFILNLLRVAGVFVAVSDRWFATLPDPTGTGDANFFWAHNVVAEALAVGVLLLIIAGLCRILPGLGVYAKNVVNMYWGDLTILMNPSV